MTEMNRASEESWKHPCAFEIPYWRDGMTPEEYDLEYVYHGFFSHEHPERLREYKPLWKQKELGMPEYDDNVNWAAELRKTHLGY